ncbi:MAG: oligosaccharide flippase family protein [Muribaculum sp.]|nr:oligosaccharide flippase family protein [Muribaculum sp.]
MGQVRNKYFSYGKNLVTYFGASLIPMALNLFANPLIAKNLSPDDYAVTGYFTSFSSLISPIIIFYLIHYYIKEYFRIDNENRKKLYGVIAKATIWFSGIVSIVCMIALWIYLKYLKTDFSFPIMPYLALMVFSLPLTGLLNLQLAQFRMEKRANAYFRLSTLNGVLGVFMTVFFVVLLRWGAMGKLLAPLICNALIFIIMLFRFRKYLLLKTPFRDYFKIFKFCLPLALSAMLGYFTQGFSTTYLESIGNTTEYGYYVVGTTIGLYLTTFSTAIGNTFQPDLYETLIKGQWKKYIKICLMQIGLIALVAVVFIINARTVIYILTAGIYVASAPYAQVIAISTVTSSIYYIINNFSIAKNMPKLYLYTSVIGSIFIICAMPFAVDRWEYMGGAWMVVISYFVFAIINVLLLLGVKFIRLPKRIVNG